MQPFLELSLILVVTTLISFVLHRMKQPLIVGYILVGIFLGPQLTNVLHSKEHIELFSRIGITALLFIVGLNLNPRVIKEVGKISLLTGVGQIVVTAAIGVGIALILGLSKIAALYVGIALTFSSTIIILKLLSDKGESNALYAKIIVGLLLVQDVVATLLLLIVPALSSHEQPLFTTISLLSLKTFGVLLLLVLFIDFVLPKLLRAIASSQELLFLFSLAWGLGIASLFYVLDFSIEIGALIAGVTLTLTPFADEVAARLKPLRDFFVVVFFVALGTQMVFVNLEHFIVPAIVLALFVLIGNPVILFILMNMLGFKRRTGFFAGMTVAQISEFSLILATLGFNLGHIDQEVLSLITFVGLITITGSTYMILNSDRLFKLFNSILKYLELRHTPRRESADSEEVFDMVLFGYDRVGNDFVKVFQKFKKNFVVVDYNPNSIARLEQARIPFRFGDAGDPDFLETLHPEMIKLVISTLPDYRTNRFLVHHLHQFNKRTIIIPLAHTKSQAEALYAAGATYVLMPHYIGAHFAANLIGRLGFEKASYHKERKQHLTHLATRLA
ncbi:sodium:proton exchanger [Candidatus Microgenomates bacterium]|nr:MAG: sodium:proton exchanger [Candidatus Microgenomates bacterium]